MKSLISIAIRQWKLRTDDLWQCQEAERGSLRTQNQVLQRSNRQIAADRQSWESLSQQTYVNLLRAEGEALANVEDEGDSVRRLQFEGEVRAYRNAQVAMEFGAKTLGLHVRRGD